MIQALHEGGTECRTVELVDSNGLIGAFPNRHSSSGQCRRPHYAAPRTVPEEQLFARRPDGRRTSASTDHSKPTGWVRGSGEHGPR